MPCPDFVSVRPEKSVPPKKLHYWRSLGVIIPEQQTPVPVPEIIHSTPDCGGTLLNMGSNTLQSDSQNDRDHGIEQVSRGIEMGSRISREDMPLDFSFKPDVKRHLPESKVAPSSQGGRHGESNSYEYSFRSFNGHMNGGRQLQCTSNETDSHFSSNIPKAVHVPLETVCSKREINSGCFDMDNSEDPTDLDTRSSSRQRVNSLSPPLHSPNGSSKSPILAGMLRRNSSEMMPVMPLDAINSRMISLGLQNGYQNGLYVPSGIQNSNSVITNPVLFPPNIAAAGLAFMQPQMNLLPPVSQLPIQSKGETKGPRKIKQERPFKNYDVSLQDDVPCNSLPWAGNVPQIVSRTSDPISSPDAHTFGPRNVSTPGTTNIVNGNSDSSSNSDAPSVASEIDNLPHSSVSNYSAINESTDGARIRSRKRKPVADSEKDASYWERRKKNNQAAKRSRENRRIKEDTVAQQALYFRSETARLSQISMHLNARIHDISMKCASLEQDKLTLTAENAMIKQIVSQKRCGQCGNQLSNKIL